MARLAVLSLTCCVMISLSSCSIEGTDLAEATAPGAPFAGDPAAPDNACRTVDDCAPSEQCMAHEGRYPVCARLDASSPTTPRGPQGQPPPPPGLLEGAPRLTSDSAGAPR